MSTRNLAIPIILLLAVLLSGCGKKDKTSGSETTDKLNEETKKVARELGDTLDDAGKDINRELRSLAESVSGKK